MKQWISDKYGVSIENNSRLAYTRLKEIVQEAWDAITEDDLFCLLNSMKARCQAVINAQGGHTRY